MRIRSFLVHVVDLPQVVLSFLSDEVGETSDEVDTHKNGLWESLHNFGSDVEGDQSQFSV